MLRPVAQKRRADKGDKGSGAAKERRAPSVCGRPSVTTNCQPSLNHAVTRSGPLCRTTEEMGMGMDETQMVLALRALRELLDNGARVAKYLREAGWQERAIGAATAQAGTTGYADLRETG